MVRAPDGNDLAAGAADAHDTEPAFKPLVEFHEVSKTGTIGDPELASAEKGKKFLDGIVKEVGAFVDDFAKW